MRIQQTPVLFEDITYPITTEELIARTGSKEIALQDGTESVKQILERSEPESFTSPEDVQLTIYAGLCDRAIGRKGYTDRDPPAMNEVEPLSF